MRPRSFLGFFKQRRFLNSYVQLFEALGKDQDVLIIIHTEYRARINYGQIVPGFTGFTITIMIRIRGFLELFNYLTLFEIKQLWTYVRVTPR